MATTCYPILSLWTGEKMTTIAIQADENKGILLERSVPARIFQLIFIIYFLLIFEGAIRKWAFPQLENVLFFIRAPFTLALYGIVLYYRIWPRANWILLVGYALAYLAVPMVIIQMISWDYAPRALLVAAYGWYNYFFYIPLAFIIGKYFRRRDFQQIIRFTLWISIASAILVFFQFYSPAKSVINSGYAQDTVNQFGAVGSALGYVRPQGFFTTSLAQTMFVTVSLVFVAYLWLVADNRQWITLALPLRIASSGAVLVMIALSGSRTLFFETGFILICMVVSALITRQSRKISRMFLWLLIFSFFIIVVWPLALPTSYNVFITRWQNASASESEEFQLGAFGRALYLSYSFMDYVFDVPPQGYLLGIKGNASQDLISMPAEYSQWSGRGDWGEPALSRHIIELGSVLGMAFVVFRFLLAAWLGWLAWIATARYRTPLPFLMAGFCGLLLIVGQITGQGSVNGFCWMFVGFTIAACRISIQNPGKIT